MTCAAACASQKHLSSMPVRTGFLHVTFDHSVKLPMRMPPVSRTVRLLSPYLACCRARCSQGKHLKTTVCGLFDFQFKVLCNTGLYPEFIVKLPPSHDNLAERSKALASGASSKERGFESHSCHACMFCLIAYFPAAEV